MVYQLIFLGADPDFGTGFVSYEEEGTKEECIKTLQMYIDRADKFDFYNTIQIVLLKSNQSITILEIFKNKHILSTYYRLH
jgi:hypothetical protein